MGSDAIGASGSNAPHANVQPSTVITYIIAIAGRNPRDEFGIFKGVVD
jgi:microcystin-dependent protein